MLDITICKGCMGIVNDNHEQPRQEFLRFQRLKVISHALESARRGIQLQLCLVNFACDAEVVAMKLEQKVIMLLDELISFELNLS